MVILLLTTVDGRNPAPGTRYFIHLYPIIYKVLCIPDGAGFLPSTVGGGFNDFFIFAPNSGEMTQFDEHLFSKMGWFNHKLTIYNPCKV